MITSMILMVVGGLTTFDTVLILTQGGPGTDTTISAYYMYDKAFKSFDFGTGSAIALVLVVAATVISLVVVRSPATTRCAAPWRACHEAPPQLPRRRSARWSGWSWSACRST